MSLYTYKLQSQNACLLAAGWQASQSITKSRDSGETLWNIMEVADSARLLEVLSMERDSQEPTLPSALTPMAAACTHANLQQTEKLKLG